MGEGKKKGEKQRVLGEDSIEKKVKRKDRGERTEKAKTVTPSGEEKCSPTRHPDGTGGEQKKSIGE